MRNLLTGLVACLTVFYFSACKQTQKSASGGEGLETVMSVPATIPAGGPVMLNFTVYNRSSRDTQFCKWHTPFEGFISTFLDIKDAAGTEVQYRGAMAKRVMPPPAEAYIKVPAGDSVSVTLDLLKGYDLTKPGQYKAVYQAGGMSGLTKVNDISFSVQ
ncbi:protease [Chitinophaga barathri]|uniref:Protease n=1 Tax=Chitinophaga barathri TaxID=1647451 RepID=A0A3N4N5M4_9BACT|nr:protease [Chitinophaga barathri]RPD42923.1 protease [Chitinophaga barathri]